MSSVIIFHPKPDAPVAVCRPVSASVIECLARLKDQHPDVSDFQIIDDSELPEDRYFRDAWKFDGSKVSHDIEKAKDIHINYLRVDRNKKLEESDKDVLKAVEKGQDLADLNAKRQALRDMPLDVKKHLDHVSDLSAIKEHIPDILKD